MKLALVGFGRFGQLIAKTLAKDFELIILDSNIDLKEKAKLGDTFKLSIESINSELDILNTRLYC